jgi:hypothetical protein
VDIHPQFPVTGVYQLHPVNRRLTAPVTAGTDGGQRVTIPLGAVSAGGERPLFVLRLRAPDKITAKRIGLVTATGRLRTRSGVVPLDEATAAVSGIAVRPKINLEQLMVRVRAIDLEAEIAQTIKQASPTAHRDLYLEARDRAVREGLTELAEQYDLNLRGLQEGKHPNDVRNSGRARSSTSTRGSDLLVVLPELDPDLVRRSDQATRSVSTRKLTKRVPPADR